MGSRVVFDLAQFKHELKTASRAAQNAVADQIIADSRQYCPDDGEHILRDSARIEHDGDGAQVVYDTPYAAYQYYGCYPDGTHVIKNHTTAGTTTQWIEHAKSANNDKWLRVAQNAMKRL